MEEELNTVLKKIKSRKATDFDEKLPEVWKTKKFDSIHLWLCNTLYKQNTIKKWTKDCILLFPKKSDLRITKNYRDITLTVIAAKVYNAMLLSHIQTEIKKIL